MAPPTTERPLRVRLAWFAGIAAAGAVAAAAAAELLRYLLLH